MSQHLPSSSADPRRATRFRGCPSWDKAPDDTLPLHQAPGDLPFKEEKKRGSSLAGVSRLPASVGKRAWQALFIFPFWFVFKVQKASCSVPPEHMKGSSVFHTQSLPVSDPMTAEFQKVNTADPSGVPDGGLKCRTGSRRLQHTGLGAPCSLLLPPPIQRSLE